MRIYVSTLAFRGDSLETIIQKAKENGISLEFSSGVPYRPDLIDLFLDAPVSKIAHNYFPPPKEPYVLNLASANEKIRRKSVNHCLRNLELTKKTNGPFFAAHAGFCVDPDPKELGEKIVIKDSFDRSVNMNYFYDSLREITDYAQEIGVPFYIENNVLARFNLHQGENPLLCADSAEIIEVIESINCPDHFGLLLDTGHLKVSAETLNLSLEDETFNLMPYIRAVHHNDNNGKRDTNDKLSKDYWFLPHMSNFVTIPHVVEVKDLTVNEALGQVQLLAYDS